MNDIKFEWDENKNIINQSKHGISFENAKSVFYDNYGILIADVEHSLDEERFLLLGLDEMSKLLVVCHCVRENDTIRIISARKATKNETKQYNTKERW